MLTAFISRQGEELVEDQFHYTMNNLHSELKFEIEKPEKNTQCPLTITT